MLVVTSFTIPMMLFLGKCCILSLYYRLFSHMSRVRYQLYGTLILALSLFIASIVMPIKMGPSGWKMPVTKDADSSRLIVAVGVIKLVVDLIILYIPIPIVLNLNLSKSKKMSVLTTFLTGFM
jgi:hypothetical protein